MITLKAKRYHLTILILYHIFIYSSTTFMIIEINIHLFAIISYDTDIIFQVNRKIYKMLQSISNCTSLKFDNKL